MELHSGEKVTESGYYTYSGHVNDIELGCIPLSVEIKRFFVKGIIAHGLICCTHKIKWVKISHNKTNETV